MPYVKVPKDFKNIKKKSLMGLTKRQLVYFSVGAILTGATALALKNIVSQETLFYICSIPAVGFLALGMWVKLPDQRTPEEHLSAYLRAVYKVPRTRYFKPDSIYKNVEIYDQIKKVCEDEKSTENADKTIGPLQGFAKGSKKKSNPFGKSRKAKGKNSENSAAEHTL